MRSRPPSSADSSSGVGCIGSDAAQQQLLLLRCCLRRRLRRQAGRNAGRLLDPTPSVLRRPMFTVERAPPEGGFAVFLPTSQTAEEQWHLAHTWPTARPPLSSGGSPQARSRCLTTRSPPRRRLSLPAPPPPRPSSCRPIRQAHSLRLSQRSRLTRRARRPRSRRARAPARASTHRSGSSLADRWPCSTPCSARRRRRSAPERRRLERRRRCAHRRSTQPQPHPHPHPQPQPQPQPLYPHPQPDPHPNRPTRSTRP